jgi:hypothetical protein
MTELNLEEYLELARNEDLGDVAGLLAEEVDRLRAELEDRPPAGGCFLRQVFEYMDYNPNQRLGQAMMNVLYEVDASLYIKVADSHDISIDPYCVDERIGNFLNFLRNEGFEG